MGWRWRLFGWWYRWQACKMAATVMAGRIDEHAHLVMAFTVFFETYMVDGADATSEFFGAERFELPLRKTELKAVED